VCRSTNGAGAACDSPAPGNPFCGGIATTSLPERLDELLAAIDRAILTLRWLAANAELPKKAKYTVWAVALGLDRAAYDPDKANADTVVLDDELVDLNGPPPF
jgi:hypothetical protein